MFKRVVRNLEFDVAEMAIMTFLVAKAFNKPYRLLPFVVMARYQHPYLVFDSQRNPSLTPEQLQGKRVGVRSYSVTTGAWIRGILMEDHGVDISRIQWVTFEEPHVAEFRDPPNVQRGQGHQCDAARGRARRCDPRRDPDRPAPEAAYPRSRGGG
jgi:4,5-dihydroxyphthalate decarboxylase